MSPASVGGSCSLPALDDVRVLPYASCMFRCILCLESLGDEMASEEHVFPQAIGGILTLREMCVPCNNRLGRVVDARLVNHRYMQWSRRKFKLAERSGKVPNPLERGTVNNSDQCVRWDNDGRVYYHPYVEDRDGEQVLIVDETDKHKLYEMLAKANARRGGEMRGEVVTTGNFSLSFDLGFDDDSYIFGILKIVYELTCKILGGIYLDDPIAVGFRSLLVEKSPSHEMVVAAQLTGQIGGLYGPGMLPVRPERESWLIGIVFPYDDKVLSYVRLFDRFDARFVVSNNAGSYHLSSVGSGWITDVATNQIRTTDLNEIQQEWLAGDAHFRAE